MLLRRVSLFMVFILAYAGCAHPPSKVTLATVAVVVMHDGFLAQDVAHQKQLVDRAIAAGKSEAEVQVVVAAYRARREAVLVAFVDAFQAAVAALKDHDRLPELLIKTVRLGQLLKALR